MKLDSYWLDTSPPLRSASAGPLDGRVDDALLPVHRSQGHSGSRHATGPVKGLEDRIDEARLLLARYLAA
ncbi:hypothetical protein, partial [Caballeronia sp. M23-90]